jgi:hypothetical protein
VKFFTTLVVMLGLLAVPVGASAADRTTIAKAIAVARWGNVCAGQAIGVSRGLTDGAMARSYYSFNGLLPDDGSKYRNCSIKFRNGTIAWPEFCTAIVHEYGHLAGWRPAPGTAFPGDPFHSGNPNSVMYPNYVLPWPKCR